MDITLLYRYTQFMAELYAKYRVLDPLIISFDQQSTDLLLQQYNSLNTTVYYQWLVSKDEFIQKDLNLNPNGDWNRWDDYVSKIITQTTDNILNLQKYIISIIDNYPIECADYTCELPPGTRAGSSSMMTAKDTYSNAVALIKLKREHIKLLQCNGNNDQIIMANDAFKYANELVVVNPQRLDYNLNLYLNRCSNLKADNMMCDLNKNHKPLVHESYDDFLDHFLDEFETISNEINTDLRVSQIPSVNRAAFKKRYVDVAPKNRRNTKRSSMKGVGDKQKITATLFNYLPTIADVPQFEEQFKTLYVNKENTRGGKVRSLESIFIKRVIQMSHLCIYDEFHKKSVKYSADTFKDNQVYDDSLTVVQGFIESIYRRLSTAYSQGIIKDTVNIAFKSSIDLNNEPISRTMRKINNLLIFGPLLANMSETKLN